MKLFTDNYATPARVQGLLRLLAKHNSPMAMEDVTAWMEAALDKPGAERKASLIVAAAVEAGLVSNVAGRNPARLKLAFSMSPESWSDERLPGELARQIAPILLQPRFNGNENRLATLAVWILCQTPTRMPQGHSRIKDALAKSGFATAEYGLSNDACVDNLIYWLRYLGLVWQYEESKADGMVPDPTLYLTWHLKELLPPGQSVTATDFCDNLGRLCPVLDRGEARAAVRQQLRHFSGR